MAEYRTARSCVCIGEKNFRNVLKLYGMAYNGQVVMTKPHGCCEFVRKVFNYLLVLYM